jgi:hypothetical protein
MKRRLLRQPSVKGGRTPAYSGLIKSIEAAIQREVTKYGVTRSFVIATALAFVFDIEDQPDYRGDSARGARRVRPGA